MFERRGDLSDESYEFLSALVNKFISETQSQSVLIIDRDGQPVLCVGDYSGIDLVSFSSLTAANVATTRGTSRLLGEHDFANLLLDGEKESLYISTIGLKLIIVVDYGKDASLGAIRLRLKKLCSEFLAQLENAAETTKSSDAEMMLLTDDDIENLFTA